MTVLANGRIYTMDDEATVAEAIVVRDGRVAFVGRELDVNPAAAEHVVDLGGRAVLPGLTDAHGHLMYLARGRFTLDAAGAPSEDAIARMVGERAAKTRSGDWISGRGWDLSGGADQGRRAAHDHARRRGRVPARRRDGGRREMTASRERAGAPAAMAQRGRRDASVA